MNVPIISALILFSSIAFANPTSDYIRDNAVPMVGLNIPAAAISEISKSNIFLIGDFHGTNEIPQVVYSIAKELSKNKKIRVGFEFPIDIQKQVAEFMATGDEMLLRQTRFFSEPDYHSGKGSQQMVQLLRDLRKLQNVEIFCFDLPDNDPATAEERETKLAMNVLSAYRAGAYSQTLIYAGNIHSRIVKGVPWDANYPTMGSEIIRLAIPQDKVSSISSLLVRPGEGSAFFCTIIDNQLKCGPYQINKSNEDYFSAVSSDYFLREPTITDGHPLSLILHKVSASMPF